jgi:hypothetical protein
VNLRDLYEPASFFGKVPLMFDERFKVYFIPTEESAQGLDKVARLLGCQSDPKIVLLKSIKKYIHNYALAKFREKQENRRMIKVRSYRPQPNLDNKDIE